MISQAQDASPGLPSRAPAADDTKTVRLFVTPSYLRLWLAQVASSLGDWVGIIAITALARRVGGASGVGVVLAARFLPGFFLAPIAGVLVDRSNRKRVMVSCDVGRALLLALVPFVETLPALVAISFGLELLTLLWSPAKDASVPNLVPPDKIAQVSSLSMVAAYGTFPFAAGLAAVLFKVAEWLSQFDWADVIRVNQESINIYFDVLSFCVSAALIITLHLPNEKERKRARRINLGETFADIRAGFVFIGQSPVVRAVMVGLGTALLGGGLVIPLGTIFADRALRAGDSGYSLLLTALGMGAAVGVLTIVLVQKRLPRDRMFALCLAGAGSALMAAAAMSALAAAILCVGAFGVFAGGGFVLGNTILQSDTDDRLRGRIFAAFYAIIRLALTIPLVFGGFLVSLTNRLTRALFGKDEGVEVAGAHIDLAGVRIALWFGSFVILGAAVLALRSLGRIDTTHT